jgi:hypothetical protein
MYVIRLTFRTLEFVLSRVSYIDSITVMLGGEVSDLICGLEIVVVVIRG